MIRVLTSCPSSFLNHQVGPLLISARSASGKWRADHGLPPRHASPSPLADLPEWSYLDGRGPGPLNIGQKIRYLRDIRFAKEVIKFVDQMKTAKELVPDEVTDRRGSRK